MEELEALYSEAMDLHHRLLVRYERVRAAGFVIIAERVQQIAVRARLRRDRRWCRVEIAREARNEAMAEGAAEWLSDRGY
jgi:hypothetical protein